jgi:hypothetical protein
MAGSGMNLRDALSLAERAGCRVAQVRRHGEYRIHPPHGGASVKVNQRRKDCPRKLTVLLRRLGAI